jgi:hypothetical protein
MESQIASRKLCVIFKLTLKKEDYSSGWLGQKARPYLHNNQSKMG